jgi:hypothetical protein
LDLSLLELSRIPRLCSDVSASRSSTSAALATLLLHLQLEMGWGGQLLPPIEPDSSKKCVIKVESAGHDAGSFASIDIGGKGGISRKETKRGLNVVLLSPAGEIKFKGTFDTYASQSDANSFSDTVDNAETGDYVLIACKDECTARMTDRGKAAIKSCGGVQFNNCNFRSSYALIGVKDAPAGTVQEAFARRSDHLPPIVQTIALKMERVVPEPRLGDSFKFR